MKRLIRFLFSLVGYEIRNKKYKDIFTIRKSFDEAFIHIKSLGFYPELVIDVGAANGTPALQDNFPESKFLWIEPLKEFENDLEKLTQQFNGEFIIAAAGSNSGELEILVEKDLVGSSILINENREIEKSRLRKVPVITLNNAAKEKKLFEYKNIILKIDVQGFELDVLDGGDAILENTEIIILEVSLFAFTKRTPLLADVVSYMGKKGYVVYDILEGINRPFDFALGQKDIVFVKQKGLFRKSDNWS